MFKGQHKAQAVILAGGVGSRLRPYTTVIPKPLIPLGEYPIIEIVIRQLKSSGFERIAISTGYLASLIEAYLGDGRRWGVTIDYIHEDRALGTAGALKLIKNLNEDFLVINGDILTDIDFKGLLQFHKQHKATGTVSVKKRLVKIDFGVVEFNDKQELSHYSEKPEQRSFVSLGVNILNKSCQRYIRDQETIGMPDLLLRMKGSGEKVMCFPVKNFWLDLGRLEDLEEAQKYWQGHKTKFLQS